MREDGRVNESGMDFYRRLLDTLAERGITPNVTLFHWDLPAHLPGGWLNRDTAYRFADYAAAVAHALGDRIGRMATLNEPWCCAFLGHDLGVFAPGVQNRSSALIAAHHLLLAHGLGVQAWRSLRPQTQVGIVLNPELCDPVSTDAPDVQAARLAEIERNDCFLNPLVGREWPQELLAQAPEVQRYRLAGDVQRIAQPLDFIGLNYYTRSVARAPANASEQTRGYAFVPPDAALATTDIGWEIYPQGLYRVVERLAQQWPLPPIWITENGAADNTPLAHDGQCADTMRCDYLAAHLQELVRLRANGYDVRGYYAWSLMDNFEWAQGYSQRFGIVHVDYATQQRTPKRSARLLQGWMRQSASISRS
jgi:beta-glucosidase